MLGMEYIRTQFGMSITDVANKLTVSRQIVSKWEKGEKNIPGNRLDELSVLFSLPKKYLIEPITNKEKIEILNILNGINNVDDNMPIKIIELKKKIEELSLLSGAIFDGSYQYERKAPCFSYGECQVLREDILQAIDDIFCNN